MEMNYRDEKELHQLEQELDVELIPGTEIMTDVGSHHFVKGSKHVLVPQPTSDAHDPLNWSPFWKGSTIVCASLVTFTQGMGPLSLAPMFSYYQADFDRPGGAGLADVVQFTGVAILVLGFSNFIWVPLSTSFGRRPVYIVSQLINLASAIWRAEAKTYGSFMGACVLNGLGAGPAETVQPAVIADIFFLHDRGKWNTLYWVVYMGSLMVGPIIAGPMAQHTGWRNYWWLNVGLFILSIIMNIFLFPETRYHRPHPSQTGASSDSYLENSETTINEKKGSTDAAETVSDVEQQGTTNSSQDPWLGRGSPAKWQWRLFQPNSHPLKSIVHDFILPWKLFVFPIIVFASFVVSWSCSTFLTLNLIQEQGFGPGTPYDFSSQTIGFFNFAILIGALIGLATAGPLSDWVSMRATIRNKGIREPEMRLPAMIPYVLVMILGNVVAAVGFQYHWPWEAIVCISFACAGMVVASLPSIASTYAVDCYKPVAGSLFVAITVNKNVWGYGFSKFITPWIIQVGFIPPIMTNMALITLWCLFAILFYYKGKTFRRWSKNSKVHYL